MGRLTQPGPVDQHTEFRTIRTAIEVAHQDHVPVCAGNLANEAKLAHAGTFAKRKMHKHQHQRLTPLSIADNQGAASGNGPRQTVFPDLGSAHAA